MTFTETRIPGVWLIDADVFPDSRGAFVLGDDPAFGIDRPLGSPTSIHERDATYPDFMVGHEQR
jgi:dTDP-4-dehydrorhamnose 3,5-epimerase-like enzyme